MKKFLPVSLALLALGGGLVACAPANNDTKPTQAVVSEPTAPTGDDAKKTDEQIKVEMTDMATQTDVEYASDDLDALLKEKPGEDEFNKKAQEILNTRTYNEGTKITFEAHGSDKYTLKGWNESGWKFTSKADALVYESDKGFTNAWAASNK
jgi:hypothetical protein